VGQIPENRLWCRPSPILTAANVPISGGHHVLCAATFAGRSNDIATGQRCRNRGAPRAAWCSGTCCIWARSTFRRNWRGAGRSKFWRTAQRSRDVSLFPEDRLAERGRHASTVHVKLVAVAVGRPAPMGRMLAALTAMGELQLDQFWSTRLGMSA